VKKYALELIEWCDVESEATWADEKTMTDWIKALPVATEVGWVYKETKEMLVMVSQMFPDGTIGNRTKIPKSLVKSRKKIKADYGQKRRANRPTHNTDST